MKNLREDLERLCTTALGYGNWLELDISSPEIQKKINEIVEKYEIKIKPVIFQEDTSFPPNTIWNIVFPNNETLCDSLTESWITFDKESNSYYTDGTFYWDIPKNIYSFDEICEAIQEEWRKYNLRNVMSK